MIDAEEKIAKSSTFNLLDVYLSFFLGIVNTFIIARVLQPRDWALIILVNSFIYIGVFFCSIFPPNAEDSLNYFIPQFNKEETEKKNQKKRLIVHVYKIRILSSIIIILISFILIFILNFESSLYLIFLIMTPTIFLIVIKNLNISIFLAFKRYKLVFLSDIIYPFIITLILLIIFFFYGSNPLIFIAFAYLLGALTSAIISIILFISKLKIDYFKTNELNSKKNSFLYIHKHYGMYLTLSNIFIQLSTLIINLLFLKFNLIIFITWLAICEISVSSALYFSSSNPNSYISIFSEINYQKEPKTFENLFYKLNKFLMLLACIIVAIMLFFIQIYITVIYSQIYLIILYFILINLFSVFSKIIIRNLFIITQSTNNTKINAYVSLIQTTLNIGATFFVLIFFSFYTLILSYLIISYLMTFFTVFIINRRIELKLNPLIFFKPIIIFLISFLLVFPLNYVINFPITPQIFLLNVFFNNAIKCFIFFIIFYSLIFVTKLLTKEEFDDLVQIIPILHSKKKTIQKIVKLIRKFLPSK